MSGPFGASSYGYNGFGDRLTQNGVNYTLDLNTGLTQVLNDGTNQYLYGAGRIAQVNATTEYFLGDALGSVRQLTNTQGDIMLANAYEPYGTLAQTAGSAQTSYGFTGEFTDPSGMVYLRARYYASDTGRFLTRDTWGGDYNSSLSLNRWMYVEGNPVNHIDPSGHSSILSGLCMAQVLNPVPGGTIPFMSARGLVNLCKSFYSQDFWETYSAPGLGPYNCAELNKIVWRKPTTANELFGDYICERGSKDHFYFNGNDKLTHTLARSLAIHNQRMMFYLSGNIPLQQIKFDSIFAYLMEWRDFQSTSGFPIMHIMGSFDISIQDIGNDRVRFNVNNRTDLASGTHFLKRFPPDDQKTNPLSLERLIEEYPILGDHLAVEVLRNEDIVSVLKPQRRDETPNGMGGGNLDQTFTWTEKNLCGLYLVWPQYLRFLDIGY